MSGLKQGASNMHFQPPHEIKDPKKYLSMVKAIESGIKLPPIVVCGEQALSGSHRIAAWNACEEEIDYIEIGEDLYIAACESMGLDPLYDEVRDYDELCQQIYNLTDDNDVKEAIKDQF